VLRPGFVAVRILPPPNGDLAIDERGRVYKLKSSGWARLDYVLPGGCGCGWSSPTTGVRAEIEVA
jgi:hypothetical protein